MELTRDQKMDCLLRQLPCSLFTHQCGVGCPYSLGGSGACDYLGDSSQYDLYISLLRDPAVPADKAAPLISVLERCRNMDNEFCDTCPYYSTCCAESPYEVFEATYNLCKEYL